MRNSNAMSPNMSKYPFNLALGLVCFTLLFPGCGKEIGWNNLNTTGNGAISASNTQANDQKSIPQDTSITKAKTQDIEELKKFSPEDLLREVRARELASSIDLSDLILERQSDAKIHQPMLASIKSNPLLSKYASKDVVQALIDQQKALYGQDNRKDVYLISSDSKLVKSANAVVSLFHTSRIVTLEDGKNSKIVNKMYGTEFRLCDTEPFYTQPCSAFCSGVLVASDIVATAGHCIDTPKKKTPPLNNIRFVFGYRMRNDENAELIISNDEIYIGQKIIKRVYTENGQDWALVKLDRSVKGRDPVPVRRSSKIQDAEDVYVIGHPCGLPAKFADGAIVKNNSNSDFFVANLDTYAGNSGSPVFNRKTHEVEGILVRGEKDFVSQNPSDENSCQISLVCPNTGCRGEDCVRTTIFASIIP